MTIIIRFGISSNNINIIKVRYIQQLNLDYSLLQNDFLLLAIYL